MKTEILTNSGEYFNFLDPQNSVIDINDIGRALSKICRFTGHTNEFYSVAQHSVLVSYAVPEQLALTGLLHDATEAYLGDVSAPLKQLLPDYKALESKIEAVILQRFKLPETLPTEVKIADLILLATEKRDLMPDYFSIQKNDAWQCIQDIKPLASRIKPLSHQDAYDMFMCRFAQLIYQSGG